MTYNGRRGPNVSQYLRDLNTVSPQEARVPEAFSGDDDLALFTNTQFFDFDSGQNTDYQAQPVKPIADGAHTTPSDDVAAAASVMGDMPNLDFMPGDFNFADFSNPYPTASVNSFTDGPQTFPLQPNHGSVYGSQIHTPHPGPFTQSSGRTGEKRKSDATTSPATSLQFDDSSHHIAEEDKRRRNTAASARFRIKKKQREQALEKSAKDMNDKLSSLESKVSQLETENKWLKNLLVEKNEGNEDISAMWKEFTKHVSEKVRANASAKKEAARSGR